MRIIGRHVELAQQALDAVAQSSTNRENLAAYAIYLRASPAQRSAILRRVVVVDAAPTIADLNEQLRAEVYWAAPREKLDAFLPRLEGWWFSRVLRQLQRSSLDRIGSREIEAAMSDLREQFKETSLPIDDDLLAHSLDEVTAQAYGRYPFVRQLELAGISRTRTMLAIHDYHRAYTQRSRWLREELVVGLELSKYERRLVDEWTREFEAVRGDLGDDAAEDARRQAARAVFRWAERVDVPIRPEVAEPFVTRGSLHMLSDELRIGWHPDFLDRLSHLLSEGGSPS